MISAKEAVDLYDASGAECTALLESTFDRPIREAAEGGKRNVFVFLGNEEVWKTVTPTPLHKQAMDKLAALGFRCQFVAAHGESYVPAGLRDDEGDGPKYRNYGIAVHW